MNSFDHAIIKWREGDPTKFEQASDWLAFQLHSGTLRTWSLRPMLLGLLGNLLLVLSPVALPFFFEQISWDQAKKGIFYLFIAFFLKSLVDRWKGNQVDYKLVASSANSVRVGDLITSISGRKISTEKRNHEINTILGIIEGYALEITNSRKGDVAVSVALYEDDRHCSMIIKHRNQGSERPLGRKLINIERVLGHIACKNGTCPMVVNDLGKFGKEAKFSPTGSSLNYKSMILVPLISKDSCRPIGFCS